MIPALGCNPCRHSSAEYDEHIHCEDMNDPSEVHRTVQVRALGETPS